MKHAWIIAVSCLVGGLARYAALVTTAAGHGTYDVATVLFPYTMISMVVLDVSTPVFMLVAVIQFPVYGVVLWLGSRCGQAKWTGLALCVLHVISVGLAFAFSGSSFFP
jgi:hypothetical protein